MCEIRIRSVNVLCCSCIVVVCVRRTCAAAWAHIVGMKSKGAAVESALCVLRVHAK